MLNVILRNIKKILLGWMIYVPLTYLFPKKKNLVLFMGRFQGRFFGNVKFLYLYLHRLGDKNIEYYFFTEHRSVYEELKQQNLPAIYHPSPRSFLMLLRAGIIVAASTVWIKKCKYHLLYRAKKVQIFHGLALKKIELGIPRKAQYNSTPKGRFDNAIRGRFPMYDLLISTSKYITEKLFAPSFRAKAIIEAGYPRNDLFFTDEDELDLLGSDRETIERARKLQKTGHRIILYAPTFRDTGGDAVEDKALDIEKLSSFAKENNAVFVFKFHLSTHAAHQVEKYDNILNYGNSADIQPMMKVADVLITDYSSVYMDYLLLDRPIVFFPYDYDKYIAEDRELLYDYDWITSGPKCHDQQQLQKALGDCLSGKDNFAEKRAEIRRLIFEHEDGSSSERTWRSIEQNLIKP